MNVFRIYGIKKQLKRILIVFPFLMILPCMYLYFYLDSQRTIFLIPCIALFVIATFLLVYLLSTHFFKYLKYRNVKGLNLIAKVESVKTEFSKLPLVKVSYVLNNIKDYGNLIGNIDMELLKSIKCSDTLEVFVTLDKKIILLEQ